MGIITVWLPEGPSGEGHVAFESLDESHPFWNVSLSESSRGAKLHYLLDTVPFEGLADLSSVQ